MADLLPLPKSPRTHTFNVLAFLLVDGFSMMSLSSAIEPLRSCNRLAGVDAYVWRLTSIPPGAARASNGMVFNTMPLDEALDQADALFVCGGLRIELDNEKEHLSALKMAAGAGLALGALSTGAHLLARAGLLRGYRCTIHWENRPAFRETFGDLDCSDKLYEIDRDRLTCSGGTAAMDLMLHLIAQDHGADMARRVAHQFHHDRIRGEDAVQPGSRAQQRGGYPAPLRAAMRAMQSHLEDPVQIKDVADRAGVSARQLERLFLQHTGVSPERYYIALRAQRAKELLMYSNRSVLDIAIATGFNSNSHMAHWFKVLYGERPTDARKKALAS